ncbi:MAG: hypothetical protein WB780_09070 [Candidatus Acidiferrales bacterium]
MSDSGGDGCLTGLYSLGASLAVVLSWERNHAILWAAIHGFISWIYVIYYVVADWSQVKLF